MILGRPTPHPTQPGRHGRPVLAPPFVEHLMGYPPGWISGLDLPRTAQLRALGNSAVPHQTAHALRLLLADWRALHPHRDSPDPTADVEPAARTTSGAATAHTPGQPDHQTA